MHLFPTVRLIGLLSSIMIAMALGAPSAHAKKDLFGNEPGSKQPPHAEQLAPSVSNTSSSASSSEASLDDHPANTTPDSETKATAKTHLTKEKSPDQDQSYLEKQLARLKRHMNEAKEDLFGSHKSSQKVSEIAATENNFTENARSSDNNQPEIPTISAAEAAQRAQALAEGQVINVRKYIEDDKPRYMVKLLQKNGRMKTINLDAVSGAPIEDTPQ